MLWDMSWEPVGKFESMEPAEILLEYSRMKKIKKGFNLTHLETVLAEEDLPDGSWALSWRES